MGLYIASSVYTPIKATYVLRGVHVRSVTVPSVIFHPVNYTRASWVIGDV